MMRSVCSSLAVMFNHRLHDLTDYGRSQDDIADAVTFARESADRFGLDRDRIGLWFFSGAGPQLSWVLREQPAHIRCAAAFYAMLDVRHLVPSHAGADAAAAAKELSPTTYLHGSAAKLPLFIARAGRDSQQVNLGLDTFVHAALSSNAAVDFFNHPEGVHCFECLNDDVRTRDILAAALTFMRRQLGL